VGWELWEMIYRIQRGGNYGWSVMEGPQPGRTEGKRGPTPILPPALAFPHTEAAAVTGGHRFRGQERQGPRARYLCRALGDAETVGDALRGRQGRLAQRNRPGDAAHRCLRGGQRQRAVFRQLQRDWHVAPARPQRGGVAAANRISEKAQRNRPIQLVEGPGA